MEIRFVLSTVFEIAVVGFIIYGLFFEDRFADAEQKAWAFIKSKVRATFSDSSRFFADSK